MIKEEILADFAINMEMREEHPSDYDEYDISMEDLIPRENTVITMTKLGYIKRMTVDNFKSQHRGGKGIKGMQTIEDDYIEDTVYDNDASLYHVLYKYRTRISYEGI